MKQEPIIITDRLKLTLLKIGDIPDVFDYAREPLVAKYTSWPAHANMDDSRKFVEYVIGKNSFEPGNRRHVWGIQVKDSPKVIGTVSFNQTSEQEGRIDYALGHAYWNKGITTEAVRGVVDWSFQTILTLKQINSGCLSLNVGSVKVLEKAGFRETERYTSVRGGKFGEQEIETVLFCYRKESDSR